jgi:broad specificity phosphatase PhoE
MIYFIRHACRADNGPLQEIKKMSNTSDPHITETGIYHSFMLGEKLSFQIPDLYSKKFLVVSSPYLRCLKTAESVLNGLKQNYITLINDQIHIEDALMEHQSPQYFSKDHFKDLNCFSKKVIFKQTAYNSLEMFSELRHETIGFPERGKRLFERFLKVLQIMENFANDPANKDTVLICVGHGFFVSYLYSYFRNETFFDYPYLSTSKLFFNPETQRIDLEFLDEILY